MGKGSRNREMRSTDNQNGSSEIKLSKKQLIQQQEKKARIKKYLTMAAVIVIAVSLVVAVVAATLAKTPKLEGVIAATSDKYEIDNAMVAYLLYSQYSNFVNQNYYMLSYYGLDTSKSLKSQYISSNQTWFGYFLEYTKIQLNELIALASEATDKGVSLDEDDLALIDEAMAELKTSANSNGYASVDRFLAAMYVNGVTADAVREVYELQQLASKYYNELIDTFEYTEEEIKKFVEDNPASFYMFDYVYYTFSASYKTGATEDEKKAALAEAKAEAEAFLEGVTSAEDFRNKIVERERAKAEADAATDTAATTTATGTGETEKTDEDYLKSFIKEEVLYVEDDEFSEWAFEDDRAVGDTKIVSDETKYTVTVYCLEKPAYLNETLSKSVRHILISLDDYADADAKAKAEEVLAEYKAGEMTEDAFAALAKKYSADGNAEDGGIYEEVLEGVMVTEFEDWIYNKDRKVGDVEIVKTTYGYHIMYFVGDGRTAWEVNSESGLKSEEYTEYLEALEKKYPVTYDYDKIANIP